MPTPAADIAADVALVRVLLVEQHPDLAALPLRLVANGWDNAVFRLGTDLAVRLPRRRVAAELVEHEQAVLPAIASRVPVAVPAPVRVGRPTARYPWSWSVVPWFEGRTVEEAGLRDDPTLAADLAAFLLALHVEAEPDAPRNPVRGGPLLDHPDGVERRLASGAVPDAERLRGVWATALAAPPWTAAPLLLHGDLHPANLIERGGRLVAVIDFGDVTGGDPATDLATAWLTFGPDARACFRAAMQPDGATWTRARGWALVMATAMVGSSEPGSPIDRIGRAALSEVLLGE
jgi:aminoglycoside phosphotransferase (APT) family kinase protein